MLNLVPMSESDFIEYRSETLMNYASDVQRADGVRSTEAATRAAQAFLKELPEGLNTPDQHLFTLFESAEKQAVGWLWLGEITSERGRGAFIYDILIREKCRGQGYGTQAMQAAEAWANELKMRYIDLHVFGHNTDARRLYEHTGFQPTHIRMTKVLG